VVIIDLHGLIKSSSAAEWNNSAAEEWD